MKDEFLIEDEETLKLFTNAVRSKIVDLLWGAPKSVKELAATLNRPVTTLYYHVNLLEARGLIRVVDTRVISGIPEKQYQATARCYRIAPSLLSSPNAVSPGLERVLNQALEETKQDIRRGVESGQVTIDEEETATSLLLRLSAGRLTESQARAFRQRLAELVAEFDEVAHQQDAGASQSYRILVGLYPTSMTDSGAENSD
jgi:predicted transcriptional regulator